MLPISRDLGSEFQVWCADPARFGVEVKIKSSESIFTRS